MTLFAAIAIVAGADSPSLADETARDAYRSLLTQFDEQKPGYGLDTFKKLTADQPMAYGLVLSAEVMRHRVAPDEESKRRIRAAVTWLTDNRDLDGDGKPGWGIPQSWDAFKDGEENPANTPYTITTAIVLEGLVESLTLEDFWTPAERDKLRELVRQVLLRWCDEIWEEGFGGGFFRYSMWKCDAVFSVNAPAMLLVPMTRFLTLEGKTLADAERQKIEQRTHGLAKAIAGTVEPRGGLPFWAYTPQPNRLNRKGANDLVHHAYILWGIEAYRDFAPDVKLPWTREQAMKSLDAYWHGGALRAFAAGDPEVPPVERALPPTLWSSGMAVAMYARYGNADRAVKELLRQHGPLPKLRYTIADKSKPPTFYTRHEAHALLGLAYAAYGPERP